MIPDTLPWIRIAQEDDIPQCATLLAELFSQEQEFTPDTSLQKKGLELIIGNPSAGVIFVCEHGGVIVGMVNLLFTISTALGKRVALLEDMVVKADSRGRGFGSMLIEHACDWALKEGIARITLLTDGDNEPAHRFYASKEFARSDMTIFRKLL